MILILQWGSTSESHSFLELTISQGPRVRTCESMGDISYSSYKHVETDVCTSLTGSELWVTTVCMVTLHIWQCVSHLLGPRGVQRVASGFSSRSSLRDVHCLWNLLLALNQGGERRSSQTVISHLPQELVSSQVHFQHPAGGFQKCWAEGPASPSALRAAKAEGDEMLISREV